MRLTTYLRTKASQALPVVLATLFLVGCQSLNNSQNSIQGELTQPSAHYLQLAAESNGDAQINWKLLAIRALIMENDTKQALNILQELPEMLTVAQDQERLLLRAELAAKQQDSKGMFQWLKNINLNSLSDVQKARYYRVEIQANQGRDPVAQLRAYINLEPLVTEGEKQKVIDQTWNLLNRFTMPMLTALNVDANENTLSEWLELLQTYQNNKADNNMLQSAVKDWQSRYSRHPASKMLPAPLARALGFQKADTSATNIALLLPLTGSGSKFSPAIQEGFNTAKSLSTTGAGTQVKVYDTGSKPVEELLAQAEQDGASVIVGPLIKTEVEKLAQSPSTLNMLALNQPEKLSDRPNICYFALSPEDEAADAARHINAQGKTSPLIIAPRGNLGDRVARAFADQWSQFGGNSARVQYFSNQTGLRDALSGGRGMSAEGQPITLSSGVTGTISGPVDAIYIVATQPELALIKPMLDMSKASKSAGLYASSRSYQAGAGPDFRFEMEGLQFSEIPMLVGLSPAISQAAGKYSSDYTLARLYGMGADAWELANHFAEISQLPDFKLSGSTGILSADNNCVVHRQLPWIQYRQGQLVPVK
ncbi:penicillin-binding protein activator [Budviciaceae bacterium CWB-B4]|uniref:Penicillin-binding protein activator LpoA n=1 Tax=Limnobaculum xujianqingii TaxID=2738837 RepID=A0A9D7AF45_9GAMM|nr:penicillin-binding protein activator [Limnobaculum xujianqingii]MBK5071546.1 penicillin-binding protein activator [Limnobaculum xujianqingii]MBK5174855.1 penicillin-binding protein activator [Limnobaculum xujianqingii]